MTRSKTNLIFVLSGLILILCTLGCQEDPDRQAAKEVRAQTAEAMRTLEGRLDIQAAQEKLSSALSSRASGPPKDTAFLAGGNLLLAQGRQEILEMELKTLPIHKKLSALLKAISENSSVQIEQKRIDELLLAGDKEIQELQQILAGDGDRFAGLHNQLQEVQAQFQALESQRLELVSQRQKADVKLQDLQARAEKKLAQAKSAFGQQKEALEKSGYDLLYQKKDFYQNKQQAVDQIMVLEDKMALLQPVIDRFKQDIEQTEQKVAELQKSTQREQLRVLKRELVTEEEQLLKQLQGQVNSFNGLVDGYHQSFDQVLKTTEQVLDYYQKIRSRDSKAIVSYKQGQAYTLLASLYASRLEFETKLGVAIEGIVEAKTDSTQSILQQASFIVSEDELLNKAVETFDQADQAFENAIESANSLRKSKEKNSFVIDVTKSRLLAVHSKMKLADQLNRFELAEEIQAHLDSLLQKANEMGLAFTRSETARLLDRGLDYQPQITFNSELFFQSIRQEITEWKRLQGPAKEASAQKALVRIQQIEQNADESMMALLEPEKKAIQEAIERGFTEAEPGTGSSISDPNSF